MGKVISNHYNKEKDRKNILFIILGVVVSVILIVIGIVSAIAGKNMRAMNSCIDAVLA